MPSEKQLIIQASSDSYTDTEPKSNKSKENKLDSDNKAKKLMAYRERSRQETAAKEIAAKALAEKLSGSDSVHSEEPKRDSIKGISSHSDEKSLEVLRLEDGIRAINSIEIPSSEIPSSQEKPKPFEWNKETASKIVEQFIRTINERKQQKVDLRHAEQSELISGLSDGNSHSAESNGVSGRGNTRQNPHDISSTEQLANLVANLVERHRSELPIASYPIQPNWTNFADHLARQYERRGQVDRRQRLLNERRRRLNERERELNKRGRRLNERGRELNERRRELATRKLRLDELERDLDERDVPLMERLRELATRKEHLDDHRDNLDKRLQQLDDHRQQLPDDALYARIREIRTHIRNNWHTLTPPQTIELQDQITQNKQQLRARLITQEELNREQQQFRRAQAIYDQDKEQYYQDRAPFHRDHTVVHRDLRQFYQDERRFDQDERRFEQDQERFEQDQQLFDHAAEQLRHDETVD